jgi:hypothetical protein
MKDVPLLDELRATRQRLAEEQGLDVDRYAAMLRDTAWVAPGRYVTEPVLRPVGLPVDSRTRSAG